MNYEVARAVGVSERTFYRDRIAAISVVARLLSEIENSAA